MKAYNGLMAALVAGSMAATPVVAQTAAQSPQAQTATPTSADTEATSTTTGGSFFSRNGAVLLGIGVIVGYAAIVLATTGGSDNNDTPDSN